MQRQFLRDCDVDETTAFFDFNPAPLSGRRDIAMLGIIRRAVLKKGPQHFEEFSKLDVCTTPRRHRYHLMNLPPGERVSAVTSSAQGLIAIYNLLTSRTVGHTAVSGFQRELQDLAKQRCASDCDGWSNS